MPGPGTGGAPKGKIQLPPESGWGRAPCWALSTNPRSQHRGEKGAFIPT